MDRVRQSPRLRQGEMSKEAVIETLGTPVVSSKNDESQTAEMILQRIRQQKTLPSASTSSTSEASLSSRPSSDGNSSDDSASFGNDRQLLKDHKLKEMLPYPTSKRFHFRYKYPLFHMSSSYEEEDSRHSEDDSTFDNSSIESDIFSDSTVSDEYEEESRMSDNEMKNLFQCMEKGFGNRSRSDISSSDDDDDGLSDEEKVVLEAEFELRKELESVVLVTSATEEVLPNPSSQKTEFKSLPQIESKPGRELNSAVAVQKKEVESFPRTIECFSEAEVESSLQKTEVDVRQELDSAVAWPPEIYLTMPAQKEAEVKLHEEEAENEMLVRSPTEEILTTPALGMRASNRDYQETEDLFCDFYRTFEILFCCGAFYGPPVLGSLDKNLSETAPEAAPILCDDIQETCTPGPDIEGVKLPHNIRWLVTEPAPSFRVSKCEQELIKFHLEIMKSMDFSKSKIEATKVSKVSSPKTHKSPSASDFATGFNFVKFIWNVALASYMSSIESVPSGKQPSCTRYLQDALHIIEEGTRQLHIVYRRGMLTEGDSYMTFSDVINNRKNNVVAKEKAMVTTAEIVNIGPVQGANKATAQIWSTRITVGGKKLQPAYIHPEAPQPQATASTCSTEGYCNTGSLQQPEPTASTCSTEEYCNAGSLQEDENSLLYQPTSLSAMLSESMVSDESDSLLHQTKLTHLCSVRIGPSLSNESAESSDHGELDEESNIQEAEVEETEELVAPPALERRDSIDGYKTTTGPFCDTYRTFEILFCCGIFYGPPIQSQTAYPGVSNMRTPPPVLDGEDEHYYSTKPKNFDVTNSSELKWILKEPLCFFKLKECEQRLVNLYYTCNPNSSASAARENEVSAFVKGAFHKFITSTSFSSRLSFISLVWSIALARYIFSVALCNTDLEYMSEKYWQIASYVADVMENGLSNTVYWPTMIMADDTHMPFSKAFYVKAVSTPFRSFTHTEYASKPTEASSSEVTRLEKTAGNVLSTTVASDTALLTDLCPSNKEQSPMEIVVKIKGIPVYSVHFPSLIMAQGGRSLFSRARRIRRKAIANKVSMCTTEEVLDSLKTQNHPSVAAFLLDQYYNEKQFPTYLSIPTIFSFRTMTTREEEYEMLPSMEAYVRELLPATKEESDQDTSTETCKMSPTYSAIEEVSDSHLARPVLLLMQEENSIPFSHVFNTSSDASSPSKSTLKYWHSKN